MIRLVEILAPPGGELIHHTSCSISNLLTYIIAVLKPRQKAQLVVDARWMYSYVYVNDSVND